MPRDRAAGLGQCLLITDAVLQNLADVQRPPVIYAVDLAEGERIDPQPPRQPIHLRLDRERHFRRAEAAHRAAGNVVGVHGIQINRCVRHHVGAADESHKGFRGDGAPRGVRAGVGDDLGLRADQPPVAVRAGAIANDEGVPLGMNAQRFGAGQRHLHRAARDHRAQHDHGLHGDVALAAERAAHRQVDQVDALLRQAEGLGDLAQSLKLILDAAPQVDAARSIRLGDRRLGFEIGMLNEGNVIRAFHHYVGIGQRAFGVADADRLMGEDVAGHVLVDERSAGAHGVERREDAGQRAVFDSHSASRGFGLLGSFGEDDGHRLADKTYLAGSQGRLIAEDGADQIRAAHVFRRQDGGHAGHHLRGRRVNRNNLGVRMLAPDRLADQHPFAVNVVAVDRRSANFGFVPFVGNRMPDGDAPSPVAVFWRRRFLGYS